jgi:hypothetical protein
MRERMVNAVQNPPAFVWAAFYGAVIGKTDVTKIKAISRANLQGSAGAREMLSSHPG